MQEKGKGRPLRRVLSPRYAWGRPSISAHCCQYALAAYPGVWTSSPLPVWPCSERGLPSRRRHRRRWWSLTPPFHPYRQCRRSAFCCACSRVSPGGRYPPSCSTEPGRSSARQYVTRSPGRPFRSHPTARRAPRPRARGTARSPPARRPHSAERTSIAPHEGHWVICVTGSFEIWAKSVGPSWIAHPPHTLFTRRAAPMPKPRDRTRS